MDFVKECIFFNPNVEDIDEKSCESGTECS